MSDSKAKSRSPRPPVPREALDALLAEPAGDPIRRAIWLGEVDRRLHPHLPPSLAAHARLANIKGSTLVFVVDAPVWSAKLRLAAPELLDVARSIGLAASEVAVKVSTDARLPPVQPPRRPIPLSPQSGQALRSALDSLRPVNDKERDD